MAKGTYDPDEQEQDNDSLAADRRPVVPKRTSSWLVWGIMAVVSVVVLYMAYSSEPETKKAAGPEVVNGTDRFSPATQGRKQPPKPAPVQQGAGAVNPQDAASGAASDAAAGQATLPPGVQGLGTPLYTATGRRIPSPEDREARRQAAAASFNGPPPDPNFFTPTLSAAASKPIVPAGQMPALVVPPTPGASAVGMPGVPPGMTDAEKSRQERLRSKMLVVDGGDGRKNLSGLMSSPGETAGSADDAVKVKLAPSSEPKKENDFLARTSSQTVKVVQASAPEDLTYKILEGKLISAVLETGIDSDLPGSVRAMIDESVYGEQGRQILLPRMTRLIGEYDNQVKNGQVRVMVVWRRAIRPDGSTIDLGSYGTDSLGRNGLTGDVDNHFFKRFGSAILISLISGVTKNQNSTFSSNNPGSVAREEAGERLQSMSGSVLEREIGIPPTIRIMQGSRIKVFVSRDLDFSAVKKAP